VGDITGYIADEGSDVMAYLGFGIILLGLCGAFLFPRWRKSDIETLSNGVKKIKGQNLYECDECKCFRVPHYWYGLGIEQKPLCKSCARRELK
jgi:hypothetical protein